MCWKTGFKDGETLPDRYPVDYFKWMPLNSTFIVAIINQLKDDDIYRQLVSYPNPEHRSVGLA